MEMLGILLSSWPRSAGLFETDGEIKLATSVCKGASSTQRGRQTVVCQPAPYWPGVASLEAGGSCPVGHDDPSNRRRQSVPPGPTSIGLSL